MSTPTYWRIGTKDGSHDFWPQMRDGPYVAIGWPVLSDLSNLGPDLGIAREELKELLRESPYGRNRTPQIIGNEASQIADFVLEMQPEDIVVASIGGRVRGVGRIPKDGGYRFDQHKGWPHHRKIGWLSFEEWDLPPKEFGARMRVYRFNNEKDVHAINGITERVRTKVPVTPHITAGVFGHIPGYPSGSLFASRRELHSAGLHRHIMAGISGSGSEGAEAIVLSGGYQDDEDHGDVIIYTGQGGNRGGGQVADQTFTRGNLWLAVSQLRGLPVRVIRGSGHRSPWSPKSGYVYSGLYTVDQYWHEMGQAGFEVYRYRLQLVQPNTLAAMGGGSDQDQQLDLPEGEQSPGRVDVTASRIIRDTKVTRFVKELYDYCCQVCDLRLELPAGPYAEGAHIRPLGRPHNGPDIPDNVLCLCPNHHVLFDRGALAIRDDLRLNGDEGHLTVKPSHNIDVKFLKYHRDHFLTLVMADTDEIKE